ncbi:MAG TPA: hypothetical protein VLA79_07545, partial [Polyangia bacterium]|nr:hypothetical protein [Polyangia bacterium]
HRNRRFLDLARERTREHMGDLEITGPPGTKVSLGKEPLGTLPMATPVHLVEGEITISATSAGYKPFSLDLSIKGGARAAVSIVLERIDLAPRNSEVQEVVMLSPPARHWRLWTGTTLAAAGAGALIWGIAWLALDGRPDCGAGQPARCGITYDTRTPGMLLAAGGGALALTGGLLLHSGLHPAPLNVTLGMTTHSLRFEARF